MNVFTYGSLMFPEIWQRTVRGRYQSTGARAHGFVRRAIIAQTYPGMMADARHTVDGVLYVEVESDDIARLDRFEGECYRREGIFVTLESGDTQSAEAYVFLRTEQLEETLWSAEGFNREEFLRTYCRDTSGS